METYTEERWACMFFCGFNLLCFLNKCFATAFNFFQGINCTIFCAAQKVVESSSTIHACTYTQTPEHLQVKATFLSLLVRQRDARSKASSQLQPRKNQIKSMSFRIMCLISCSSFPFHSNVSCPEFYHWLWLCLTANICIEARNKTAREIFLCLRMQKE